MISAGKGRTQKDSLMTKTRENSLLERQTSARNRHRPQIHEITFEFRRRISP